MKVLSTTGLTKLIQLTKSSFVSATDIEQTSEVSLATVATTGAYSDLSGKPTVDQTYNASSTNAQSGVAVASAISGKADDNAVVHIAGTETITGNKTFTGSLTIPASTIITKEQAAGRENEGGELQFEVGTNSPLLNTVKVDVYQGRFRVFGTASNGDVREIINADIENNNLKAPSSDSLSSVITTTGINKSQNGYVKLGNGLIIQWGFDTQSGSGLHTVTLPTAFTSVNYKVIGNVEGGNWSSNTQYINAHLIAPSTTTTFTIYRVYNLSTNINWIAIGY